MSECARNFIMLCWWFDENKRIYDGKRERKNCWTLHATNKTLSVNFLWCSLSQHTGSTYFMFSKATKVLFFMCSLHVYPETVVVFHENTRMPQITSTARIPRIQWNINQLRKVIHNFHQFLATYFHLVSSKIPNTDSKHCDRHNALQYNSKWAQNI